MIHPMILIWFHKFWCIFKKKSIKTNPRIYIQVVLRGNTLHVYAQKLCRPPPWALCCSTARKHTFKVERYRKKRRFPGVTKVLWPDSLFQRGEVVLSPPDDLTPFGIPSGRAQPQREQREQRANVDQHGSTGSPRVLQNLKDAGANLQCHYESCRANLLYFASSPRSTDLPSGTAIAEASQRIKPCLLFFTVHCRPAGKWIHYS